MLVGGIFSVGGLYVSFGNMKDDIQRHTISIETINGKINAIDNKLATIDMGEVKELNTRVARMEGSLLLIDHQLDRIERSVGDRR